MLNNKSANLDAIWQSTNGVTIPPQVESFIPGMQTSSAIQKIVPALLKSQLSMGDASKDAKNPYYKSSYADLNAVREAVMPALATNNIGVFQPTITLNGAMFVRTLLLHESGEYISSDTAIVVAKQNDPQALGSAISYARRYGLQSLMNCGAVDDDGEKAMVRNPDKTPEQAKANAAPTKTSSFRTRGKISDNDTNTGNTQGSQQMVKIPPIDASGISKVVEQGSGWE